MRIELNTRRLKAKQWMATLINILGMVLLIAATLGGFLPNIHLPPFPLLVAGSLVALIGLRATNEWLRVPYTHETLNAALRGLGKQASIYHYWFPAKHVLIAFGQVFVLTPRHHATKVSLQEGKLRTNQNPLQKILNWLGQDAFGNPLEDAREDAQHVRLWLKKHLSKDIDVHSVVVMTHPKATIENNDHQPAVVHAGKQKPSLKSYIRELCESTPPQLTPEDIEQIDKLLLKT
jgi:hypothetical protein